MSLQPTIVKNILGTSKCITRKILISNFIMKLSIYLHRLPASNVEKETNKDSR